MLARLQEDILERVERLADRVVRVADALGTKKISRRIVDQLLASGTSVGASVFEADEALSRPDFIKCLCIATKELDETRFWIRLISRHDWIRTDRLAPLLEESQELRRIFGSMISRTKRGSRS